jgi:hypothetical protein
LRAFVPFSFWPASSLSSWPSSFWPLSFGRAFWLLSSWPASSSSLAPFSWPALSWRRRRHRRLRLRARTILHHAGFFFLFFFLVKILFQSFAVGAAVAVFIHFVIPAPEGPIIEAHISSCVFGGHRGLCAGAQENKTTVSNPTLLRAMARDYSTAKFFPKYRASPAIWREKRETPVGAGYSRAAQSIEGRIKGEQMAGRLYSYASASIGSFCAALNAG